MRSLYQIPILWAISLILLNLIISCGGGRVGSQDSEDEGPVDYSPGTQVNFSGIPIPILFDSVSYEEKNVLLNDLSVLAGMPATGYVGDQTAFEVSEFSGRAIGPWLYDRVKVIFGKDVSFTGRFPEPEGSPLIAMKISMEGLLNTAKPSYVRGTYASNLGAYLNVYQKTIQKHTGVRVVYTTQVDGITFQTHNIRSAPFVILGDAYYRQRRLPLNNFVLSVLRDGTLIHEGRHSDGKDERLGFSHVACEDDSRPKVCDKSINGPSAVKREFLKYAKSLCQDCNLREAAVLDTAILDSASRVRNDSSYWDPAPEVR